MVETRRAGSGPTASAPATKVNAASMTRAATSGATSNRQRTKAKKRKRDPPPPVDDTLYEIRGIIGEKRRAGKLYYHIDWCPHPRTGESYSPTWEPAENVTEGAIADWERSKVVISDSSSDERPAKRTKHSPTDHDPADRAPGDVIPANGRRIVVKIPATPLFDRHEFRVISSSQSTDEQPERSAISQTTIPDSQALTDSLPSIIPATASPRFEIDIVPETSPFVQVTHGLEQNEASLQVSQSSATRQQQSWTETREGAQDPTDDTLESQEESLQEGAEGSKVGTLDLQESSVNPGEEREPRARKEEGDTTRETAPWSTSSSENIPSRQFEQAFQEEQSNNLTEGPDSSPFFLTQPEIDIPLPEPSSQSVQSTGTLSPVPTQDSVVILATDSVVSSHSTSQLQAAQIISNSVGATQDSIRTRTQGSQGEGSEVIPETVRRTAAGNTSLEALSEFRPRPSTEGQLSDYYYCSPQSDISCSSSPHGPWLVYLTSSPTGNLPSSPPGTPLTPKMSDSAMDGFASAGDARQQLQAAIFGDRLSSDVMQNPSSEPLESHESLLQQTLTDDSLSAVEQLKRGLGLTLPNEEHTSQMGISPTNLVVQPPSSLDYQHIPATVAPSDLTTSFEHMLPTALDHTISNQLGIPHAADPRGEVGSPIQFPSNDSDDGKRNGQTTFIVTLPMAANGRDRYLRLINAEKDTMIKFSEVFTNSTSRIPNDSLIVGMDNIFRQLYDICDLPAYTEDVHIGLDVEGKKRHATGTNSKYLFVHEFLTKIRDLNGHVLLLCSPGTVFEYLEAVISADRFRYVVLGRERQMEVANDGLTVILSDTEQDLSGIRFGIDVVVSFDRAARAVELPPSLAYDDELPVIVLSLVMTHTVEHIEMDLRELHEDLDEIEARGALTLAIPTIKKHLRAPDGAYPEPHEAAEIFANVLLNPTDGIDWEHQQLPPETFELYFETRPRRDLGGPMDDVDGLEDSKSRKRPSDDVDEGFSKRPRILEVEIRQPKGGVSSYEISELLKKTLAKFADRNLDSRTFSVGLGQLEAIAARLSKLEDDAVERDNMERRLKELTSVLESQLRSHQQTSQQLERKFTETLHDRSTFEKQCKEAEERAAKAEKKINEFVTGPRAQLNEQVEKLKSQLAEARAALADSSNPELVKWAQTERELADARAKIESLEKKINLVQKEAEYSRSAYQDASNRFGELNQENNTLKSNITELERRAGENIVKIHEINARAQQEMDARRWDEMRALLQDREREIALLRDENRHLKNTRRETRGGSVPRSPRTAMMMSPQPRRGGFAAGATPSRGTSPAPVSSDGSTPVPGMTYLPPGNGRWGHLRD